MKGIAIYPMPDQEEVLLRYCRMAARVYQNCYELRTKGNGYFNITDYAIRGTSPAGEFNGYPVWLVIRMAFVVSMDLLDGVDRDDVGSFFGLGSDATYTPNRGLTFENIPGYIQVQEGYVPVVMPDKVIHKTEDGWYMSWR